MERSRSSSLSEDLLEEILSRLPVKTLIRFQCAKKSWCNLFQNQRFIAKHHRHRCCSQHSLFIQNIEPNPRSTIYIMSLLHPHPDSDDDFDVRHVDMVIRFNSNRISMRTLKPNMCACINGVICIGGSFFPDFDGFFLWNPAIRQYKVVPYPTLPPYSPKSDLYNRIVYAFGYDHNSNDYKVVRIFSYMMSKHCVHVYTLSTDCWRQKIDTCIDHSYIYLSSNLDAGLYHWHAGLYHWLGFLNDTDEGGRVCQCEVILSFDMSHETFRIIRLLKSEFGDVLHMRKTLAVFNDCLALIFNDTRGTERSIHIWVMQLRESGIKESWTKQFVVGPLVGIQRPLPLGFVKNGELLLLLGDDEQTIVLYNIGSKEIKNLQFREFPNSWITTLAISYVESLVSFTGENVFQN